MTYQEILENARTCSGPHCKVCPVCNGRACKNTMPGPGSKGSGTVAARNYDAWQNLALNMDTICKGGVVDTSFTLFGQKYALPVFAGPVGAVNLHYGDKFNDEEYNAILVSGCAKAGIAAFTGDGLNSAVFTAAAKAIGENGGKGIPTVKPWDKATVFEKLDAAKATGAKVFAMDIDAAGLPFLKGLNPPAGPKTVEELKEIIEYAGVPFIIKGVMTVKGALKALEAGASGIVVSNHGGRVLDSVPATAEVLPAIADAVKGKMTILVDGGIRSGIDVCKALALGADAVIMARPYVTAVYGGGEEGVKVLTEKIKAEMEDTMAMCGVYSLSEINRDMLF
ncbi:MAG: alpha-hydroxy-acid oxidizing protein [Oscillospiraceae bacterium]|nr:alpha-hydroxy-acid oxidizing protein [Oscillospiraceae bacterium]